MDYFEIFYTVVGGLGIFFLGLMYLSEALQSSGRETISSILARVTTNRVFAVLAGIGVTAFVQSSSISTVMTVSLVNAGLLNLTQALGIILGANIGTTITGWIISIDVGDYGLLFIGVGLIPMLAGNRTWVKATGKTAVALGLIFVGLNFMSDAFRPLRTDETFISYLSIFDAESLWSLLACVAVGCILTVIVQSSSAMLGITITLAATGVIDFNTAVALILGENIGTTITAQLASIGANTSAVRAARGHAIFNGLGALFMVAIFPFYVDFIEAIVPGEANFIDASGDQPNIALHIAMAHTFFNIVNVLVWIPFINQLTKIVCFLVPQKGEEEMHGLKYLGSPTTSVPGVGLQEAELEMDNMTNIVKEMFSETREYITAKEHNKKQFKHIKHMEEVTDKIDNSMINFVIMVQTSQLTAEQSSLAYSYIRIADEVESIADCLQAIALYRSRLFEKNNELSEDAWKELMSLFQQTEEYFEQIAGLRKNHMAQNSGVPPQQALDKAEALKKQFKDVRNEHLNRISDGRCLLEAAQTFSDMTIALRRIRGHGSNVIESLHPGQD